MSAPPSMARSANSCEARTPGCPRRASPATTSSTIESKPPSSSSASAAPCEAAMRPNTFSTTMLSTLLDSTTMVVDRRRHHPSPSTGPSCTTSRPAPRAHRCCWSTGSPRAGGSSASSSRCSASITASSPSTSAGSATPRPRGPAHDSATAAEDLVALIAHLDLGPVHLTGQDISGATTFRVAATHPELVRSYTAIETGLPGFGFETLADVAHGGAWHIGVLAAPGIPEMLLAGASARSSPTTRSRRSTRRPMRSPTPTSTSSPAPTRGPAASPAPPACTARR